MELTLAYEMGADKPITDVTHQVEATAELVLQPPAEGPGEPGRSYAIVPRETRADNKITAVFPLDIGTFYADMKAAAQENPARIAPSSYDLLVKAVVKSTAKSAYGPIEGVFQQEVTLKLDEKGVQWPEVKPATKSGSIKEKVSVPSRRGWVMRLGFMGGLAVVVGAALYGAWNYRRLRPRRLPGAEAEALRAKKKHRDILVDVQGLPANGGGEKVVRFDSLEELVKTADALLKPVLHEVRATRHTYCVIDSTARYVYVSDGEAQSSPGDLGSED